MMKNNEKQRGDSEQQMKPKYLSNRNKIRVWNTWT